MQQRESTRFAANFVAVLVVLATLVGAYVGAVAIDLVWLFWILVPIALLLVLLRAAWPRARRTIFILSTYNSVEQQLQAGHTEIERLKEQIDGHAKQVADAFTKGRIEGRREVTGATLTLGTLATLKVIGVALKEDDVVIGAAVVEGRRPPIGARYDLQFDFTGDRQGALEVAEYSEDDSHVLLEVVDERVPAYWQALRDRAVVDQSPLQGCTLVAPELTALEDTDG